MSEPRVRTLQEVDFLYTATETTLNDLPATIHRLTPMLAKAMKDSKAEPAGAPLLVYHGVTQDPTTKFKLEIGYPVHPGASAAGEFKLRHLAPFHCATVLYSGPIATIGEAYTKLAAQAPAGAAPANDESRQMLLYWESEQSPNNVILIMIGIR